MWKYQKGYMKELPLAGGVLSVMGTFNPHHVGDRPGAVAGVRLRRDRSLHARPVAAALGGSGLV